jgi:hypothetical protein
MGHTYASRLQDAGELKAAREQRENVRPRGVQLGRGSECTRGVEQSTACGLAMPSE